MLRGMYTAAAGMVTQQRRHDILTNNISNLNTPGYKAQHAVARSFPEMLISLVNGEEGQPVKQIGRVNMGVMVEEVLPIFTQGDLHETRKWTDVALVSQVRTVVFEGEEIEIDFDVNGRGTLPNGETVYRPQAFFTVWNENDEVRYTRNGQFVVDPDGTLRTTDGHRVLGLNNEPIVLDRPLDEVRITASGALLDLNLEPIDGVQALLVSQVDDPFRLVREGHGYFRLNDEDAALARPVVEQESFAVRQGFIERSNVNAAQTTVDIMAALRHYEANQRIVQYYDRSMEKTVNEIGRV